MNSSSLRLSIVLRADSAREAGRKDVVAVSAVLGTVLFLFKYAGLRTTPGSRYSSHFPYIGTWFSDPEVKIKK